MAGFTAAADEGGKPVVQEVGHYSTTISNQPIVLPKGNVEVVASVYSIAPGQTLPVHRHRYPRYGYVLSGELTVTNEATNRTQTFGKGQFVVESVLQWHQGRNAGTSPLELLVIDQLPQCENNNTEVRTAQK
ncbi:cupin domain-containing protein [Rhizobium aegyptiacum]|uniref:cupin domain-containing protein n=1 Tax=Rhizobium aegyptiacum TaxID=1764550 RepID=UPI000AF4D7DF|nr:cupin domain-containing protein [Rhizobium aegyptiacum]